jgi:uncharacterized protein
MNKKTVLVVGASDKPDRYSHKAILKLQASGYHPIGIHPTLRVANGAAVYADISDLPQAIKDDIHSITMYVSSAVSDKLAQKIVDLQPPRVIWNPGSENSPVAEKLQQSGIGSLDACTLVLLSTDQFDD